MRILAGGLFAIFLAVSAHLGTVSAASVECSVAAIQAKAPAGTTITSAQVVEAARDLPRYCRVEGHSTSVNNEVNFRLGLPDSWNGKFLFAGIGGLGGSIGNIDEGLRRGYASASTDTGHLASDPDWGKNREKEIDYGHRGTHVTTVSTKALAASFYGKPLQHAYFNGCSNGGRQAMMEVQRYPEDFDGIIGGHPATGTPMQAGRAAVYQTMLAAPENYLTTEKIELLSSKIVAACDEKDGLVDGLVSNPPTCNFNVDTLACKGADAPDCLTKGQIATIKKVYGGVKTADGKVFAYGFPMGHEGGVDGWRQWISGRTPPAKQEGGQLAYAGTAQQLPSGYGLMEQNFRFLGTDDDDPAYSWKNFNVDTDLPKLKTMTEILSPLDPDLRPYKKHGGKIIIYHGWSDPGISSAGTVAYYNAMTAKVGGEKEAESFARLYMIPGMHHCGGGPGPNTFDMITVLENWVEKGQAPGGVIASHATDGKVDRTRPLCPYPQMARYTGKGSIDEAANFVCK